MLVCILLSLRVWLGTRHWPATCAVHLLTALSGFGESCKGKNHKGKLEDWKQMAKLHRENNEANAINQSNSRVSIFNFQWASFASGASTRGVVALICRSFIICCLWKAKAGRRQCKNQERLLAAISTISSPANSSASSAPARPPVPFIVPAPITRSDWLALPPGRLAYPHQTLLNPVGFQGSRFPSSHHCFTGTSPDVATQPAEQRLLRCAPSLLSLTTEGVHRPDSSRSEERILTSGHGGRVTATSPPFSRQAGVP